MVDDSLPLARAPSVLAPALAGLAWRNAFAGTVAVASVLVLATHALPSGAVWSRLTPGVCEEYCEGSLRCGPLATRAAVQQPLNAWSNLAYLFAGLLAWRRRATPTAVLFGASAMVLAAGSFGFHASVTRELQWLDMAGTYAVLVALLACGLVAAFALPEMAVVAGALVADALFAVFKWHIAATVALPLLLAAIAVPMIARVSARRITVSDALVPFALMAAAVLFRQLDVAKVGCLPGSRAYQGHALWHALTAASLVAAFACFARGGARERA